MINKTISNYIIIKKLGEGGMGEVYLAEDIKLERKVALKFLPTHYTKDSEVNARFQREAKAAAALNHPNIITVYEIGEYEGRAFIAMEYIDGQSLRDVIAESELPMNRIIEILSQICQGLAKAHHADIVHRDLKPENIMLDADGKVRIVDFGLAKLKGKTKLTAEASTLGTIYYMSPEQCQGGEVDQRSDIWAVGIMLYEMITKKLPFEGEYEAAIPYSILSEQPEPLSRYKSEITLGWQNIVDKALEKDRGTRYQHIDDLLADLKREKRDSSTVIPVGKVSKSISRQSGLTIAGLAVILALIALLTIDKLRVGQVSRVLATHKQVTFTGNASYPAISPDGQFIAYFADKKKLMLRDLSGGQPVELFETSDIWNLLWSPKGSEILASAIVGDGRELLLFPRLGGRPRSFGRGAYIAWSPDGAWIATAYQNWHEVALINKLTGEEQTVPVSGFQWQLGLDWSPKGDFILILTRDNGKYALRIVRIDGNQQRKLFESDNELQSPRWSPTGDAIYFFSRKDNTTDLMKLSVSTETGEKREDGSVLLNGLQAGDYFTLSADGKRLLYTRSLRYSNLWLTEFTGREKDEKLETKPLTQGTLYHDWPSISPGGKWVAFTIGQSPRANIYKVPIEGGTPEQLTFSDAHHASPVWSPDGKRIAFASNQGGSAKVWTMDTNGRNPRQFTETQLSSDGLEITWPLDDKLLYQRPGNRNFYILNPKTEEERPLIQADSVGWVFWPSYSPDGTKVAVYWNRIEYGSVFNPHSQNGPHIPGLWVISPDDDSQTRLSDQDLYPVGWSPDGNWIYASHAPWSPQNTLVKVSASGGEPQTVFTLPGEIIGASVGPYGRKIVCSVAQTQSDVWLMENFDPEVGKTISQSK